MGEKILVVQNNKLIKFAYDRRKKWQLWKDKILLSPFIQTLWLTTFDCVDVFDKAQDENKDSLVMHCDFDGLCDDGTNLNDYKYFVVIRATKYLHRTRYYSYEHEYYSKKFHRRMSKPVFVSDINKAEFIKSRKYADEVATRCRQTGTEMVAVREVYVYRPNELLQKNIVVVVKHKTNEKMKPQFLRDYNEETGNFIKTSKYEQAKLYTYDEYLQLYDNFHALHKNYFILPKIVNGGKPWNHKAKEVDGREQVEGTLRLRSE